MGRAKFGGELHRAQGLAIAFGLGHAPVAENFLLGVAALLLADHHDGALFEPAHAGDHGVVVGEETVAVDLVEIGEQALDVIERMRTLGVARQLHAIPTGIDWAGGVWESAHCRRSRQLARTSIASAPQRRETSAQNSLSGRTLTVTSRITEKSRGFSRRRRTSVSPGLARNRFWSAAAQSARRRRRSPEL